MNNAMQKCGVKDRPPAGKPLLPPDFLVIPFKRFLKDKGAAELIAPLEEQVVDLRAMAVAISEQVREENARVGEGLLTLRYNPNSKEGRWRARQAILSLIESQVNDAPVNRYTHFNPFDTDWAYHSLFDSILRVANSELHRFYRAADFALLEIEARIECCRRLISALDSIDSTIERKSKMTLKERDLVADLLCKAADACEHQSSARSSI